MKARTLGRGLLAACLLAGALGATGCEDLWQVWYRDLQQEHLARKAEHRRLMAEEQASVAAQAELEATSAPWAARRQALAALRAEEEARIERCRAILLFLENHHEALERCGFTELPSYVLFEEHRAMQLRALELRKLDKAWEQAEAAAWTGGRVQFRGAKAWAQQALAEGRLSQAQVQELIQQAKAAGDPAGVQLRLQLQQALKAAQGRGQGEAQGQTQAGGQGGQ